LQLQKLIGFLKSFSGLFSALNTCVEQRFVWFRPYTMSLGRFFFNLCKTSCTAIHANYPRYYPVNTVAKSRRNGPAYGHICCTEFFKSTSISQQFFSVISLCWVQWRRGRAAGNGGRQFSPEILGCRKIVKKSSSCQKFFVQKNAKSGAENHHQFLEI